MLLTVRTCRRWLVPVAAFVLSVASLPAQAPVPARNVSFPQFSEADAREWLTYLSSDALQGREVFTEGYGLAAAYVADHLRQWGLKPLGDNGTYFQSVKQRGYQIVRNSTVTIEAKGQSRSFKHGDHVSFSLLSGGAQTLVFNGIEVGGDFSGRDVKGKLVVLLPFAQTAGRGAMTDRTDALVTAGAAAVISFAAALPATLAGPVPPAPPAPPTRGGRGGRGRGAAATADITTVERVDRPVPPVLNGDEAFFNALFDESENTFADLRAKSEKGEPLPVLSLPDVRVTVKIDNTFKVVATDLTENVVGMVEGTDDRLKDTYVLFGAHLDHVGYSKAGEAKGRVNNPIDADPIWNGADDDGSGSTALLAIAKAFASGPKPRRSVVIIWHAGEEAGLLGSRYNADFPVVPIEKIQAEFNIDMIGRNRDDKDSEANKLYVIGADRISTDLHNLVVETNAMIPRPFDLDFEFNDAADVNSFYTRSDHYSYASKGVPIAFFFTGTHPDYHANSDEVSKILFPKLVRVAQMIYEAGFSLAATDRTLDRDNLGARAGKGFQGTIEKKR